MSGRFDAIIIGAGQAGPSLAGRLTAAGQKVALIERKLFGGTCVNTGCTPTKTLVASAYAAHLARRAGDFGVGIAGAITIDMAAVMARKDAVVAASRSGLEGWLKGMEKCTVYEGQAQFVSPHEVKVGDVTLSAERIFINVGGRAIVPDMPGVHDVKTLTNTTILALDHVPAHLVIIGGSYIGLEFAQIFRRFGAAVTIVEKAPRLISREDEDVSAAVKTILEAEGIAIRLDAECIRFVPRGDSIGVGVDCTSGEPEISGSHVLLAVGRRPNTEDLGLANAGVAVDARGTIIVDDELCTTVPHIFAMGDCNGKGAFTHTAYNDFEIIAANLLDGEARLVSARIPGYALYIDPPLGRVGLSEKEARAAGHKVRVGMRPMTRVGRAAEKGETQGFMKIVVDADNEAILGAAILGVGGDEAIHGVLDMMNAKMPYPVLRWAVPIHPTVSELIPTLLTELGPAR
ncbi:FAD-containing oxidoreductase [Beijerinckia sp. L45]|uniref:FAD-containing oxidoreductase n=1 Tax=Beijerinckia sp. L45 TaxID=1641855 RepID=UPI00131AE4D8|nr:FAD-containing oxidoreductase [Beijerinckia sp. L45]